jgi:hypothetical protein
MLHEYFFNYFYMQGRKIHAMVSSKHFNKFKFSLKEKIIFIMHNFRVSINEIQEVMTTSHIYCLNFTDKTKIRHVDHGIVPYYSYFFTHPSNFHLNSYKYEVILGEFRLSLLNFMRHHNMI